MNRQSPEATPHPRTLQHQVWSNVMNALNRRRRNRWILRAGVATGLYALGIATAVLWSDNPETDRTRVGAAVARKTTAVAPVETSAKTPRAIPVLQGRDATTELLPAWQRAKHYGDKFLLETDVAAATRQYRRYLDGAAENGLDLAPTPEDNWLLHALKRAYMEERNNA